MLLLGVLFYLEKEELRMVIAFQVLLLVIMLFSVLGAFGERENKGVRDAMVTIFIASTAAFIVSVMWL